MTTGRPPQNRMTSFLHALMLSSSGPDEQKPQDKVSYKMTMDELTEVVINNDPSVSKTILGTNQNGKHYDWTRMIGGLLTNTRVIEIDVFFDCLSMYQVVSLAYMLSHNRSIRTVFVRISTAKDLETQVFFRTLTELRDSLLFDSISLFGSFNEGAANEVAKFFTNNQHVTSADVVCDVVSPLGILCEGFQASKVKSLQLLPGRLSETVLDDDEAKIDASSNDSSSEASSL